MKKAGFFLAASFCLILMTTSTRAATYFSQGSVTPNTLTNWNTNRGGGGTSPANFTTAGDIFVIQGTGNGGTTPHSMTTTAALTFGAAGSKLQIESGGALQADNAITIASGATFQIDNGGTYTNNNTGAVATTIFNGTESFGATSNFIIRLWGATATSSGTGLTTSLTASIASGGNNYFYGNLTINTTAFTGAFSPGLSGTVRLCVGDFAVNSTGSGAGAIFRFATAAAGPTVWVLGNYSQATGTSVDFNNNPAQTANTTLSLTGNFTLSGTAKLDNVGSSFASISFVKSSGTQTVNVSGTAVQPWMLWTVGDGTTTNTVQLLSSLNVTGTTGIRVATITINSNATLDLNGFTARIEGSTTGNVVVTGTLTGTVASSKLLFSSSSTSTTTLSGAGTVNGSNLTVEYNHIGTGVNLIGRDLTINTLTATAGTVRLNATATLRTINLTNFSMAAGTLDTGSVDVTGNITAIVNLTGNFSKTSGTVTNSSPSGLGLFVFKGTTQSFSNTGTFQFTIITVTNSTALTLASAMAFSGVTGPILTIDPGSTLAAGTNLISTTSASGNFVINGTLQTANGNGFSGSATTTIVSTNTPTITLGSSSTIEYNSSGSQTVTVLNYANLTSSNSGSRTLPSTGTIGITGTFTPGANSYTVTGSTIDYNGSSAQAMPSGFASYNNLTISNAAGVTAPGGNVNVGGNFTNNGVFNNNTGTIIFNGSSPQIIGGTTSTTFQNLTINSTSSVTLNTNASANGVLTLNSDLTTGAAIILTMPNTGTSAGTADVVGNVKRTGPFAINTPYSYGNPNVTITFTTLGTTPSDLTINLAKSAPTDFTVAIARTYTITPNGGSLFIATVRLHYLTSELNGNTETDLTLWRKSGSVWGDQLKSGQSTTSPNNWAETTGVTAFSPWTLAATAPTAIELARFEATGYDGGALIEWQTGFEVSNLGFNIYRQEGRGMTRINPQPIAGSALLAGSATTLRAGHSYAWWDESASKSGGTYWLEDLDLAGKNTLHGPFYVKRVGGQPPQHSRAATLSQIGKAAPIIREIISGRSPAARVSSQNLAAQWQVAASPAVKISVRADGWHRITQAQLLAAGLNATSDPRLLQLFADGSQVPMKVTGGEDGSLDPQDSIEFYGLALDTPSADARVYWLVAGAEPGQRIGLLPATGGTPTTAQSFTATVERKDRTIYFAALKNGEVIDNFFGPIINSTELNQTIALRNVDGAAAEGATLEVALQGVTDQPASPDHTVNIKLNGTLVGSMIFDGQARKVESFSIPANLLTEGDNTITLQATGGQNDVCLVDYLRVSYRHRYVADNDKLIFKTTSNEQYTVTGFSEHGVRVYDITNAAAPVELAATVEEQKAGFAVKVRPADATERTLIAVADSQASLPSQVVANAPSKWNVKEQGADIVMIAHQSLAASVAELKAYRQSQGFAVSVINVEDLYDEFGYGARSPQAVKDFLTRANSEWKKRPRYVLLVGDASLDPHNYLGFGDWDQVPTKLVETGYLETASDDWLADFNGDGVTDLALGRLPARTASQAAVMVEKILAYERAARAEGLLMVVDRNEGYDFESMQTQLRLLVPNSVIAREVRRSQTDDQTAHQKVLAELVRGPGLVNYIGHGSVAQWNGNLLVGGDAASLANSEVASVYVMMTCLTGFMQDVYGDSLSESLMGVERGGAVAVWASSGLCVAEPQAVMNQELYRQMYNGGAVVRLGDAARAAKQVITDPDVKRTWVLLGDPAMRIKH